MIGADAAGEPAGVVVAEVGFDAFGSPGGCDTGGVSAPLVATEGGSLGARSAAAPTAPTAAPAAAPATTAPEPVPEGVVVAGAGDVADPGAFVVVVVVAPDAVGALVVAPDDPGCVEVAEAGCADAGAAASAAESVWVCPAGVVTATVLVVLLITTVL